MTITLTKPPLSADALMAAAIRVLSVDMVEAANSGHPGAPLGMAEMATALWGAGGAGFLRHNPANPKWPDRDRFVLSNGHASPLIYSLLHLTGYDLTPGDLSRFRQMHSRTPGHPEVDVTPGVETTTGPLGQGLANAVGMALAEKLLAAEFNRPGFDVVDHHTYVFLGDGCLMEGISHEACSLAGTLKLGKLVCLWDDNGISIDGPVDGWFTDDTPGRFEAYGWQVIRAVDGHDVTAVRAALAEAKADADRPTLICCRTQIGRGAPTKAGSHKVHGAPLGAEEVSAMRTALGWRHAPFTVPDEIMDTTDARPHGARSEAEWRIRMEAYREAYPAQAAALDRRMKGDLASDWPQVVDEIMETAAARTGSIATRKASAQVLEQLCLRVPEMFGGSADLTGSNLTDWPGAESVNETGAGRYLSYGVREFALAAIMNGMALHGGFIPFGGTFLTFSDYSRNAIRMAALMKRRVVHVLTHDSIGLGEDGPTHQPVEHAASLRLIPNLAVWRPCDAVETAAAWCAAVETADGPTALLLSRQGLPCQGRDADQVQMIRRGGYVLAAAEGAPTAVVIATGSEVALALAARKTLGAAGRHVAVVSMPCRERFLAQDRAYRDSVLPPGVPRLAVEAGHPESWWRLVGPEGDVVGMETFGESAPAGELFAHFGFTPEAVAERLGRLVGL
ncbi:Transketolase [Caenispirillum salinarum AK4]|uniref:Transketolase n=1 Tax=Caenispirillum salinarum AK4 TaxID=1238182 RepID=K9GLX8_9PROT|nr:transketolase [Caenispirillum salinarum]EKV27015.1 Transketolase [Caenispirillum salinarum AK4]